MTYPGQGSWLGLLAINLFVIYNVIRFGLAARLLTGLRTYLLPEAPGAQPAQQVGGGEGKVTAIELPAAAVAVADGFQELEWLLLAGVLAPLNVAATEAAVLALGWPRDARALTLCAGVAGYALFCLYTVAQRLGPGFKAERRNGAAFGVALAALLAPLLELALLAWLNTASISLGVSDAALWLSGELAAKGVALGILERVRVSRVFVDRTLALLAGGLAALLLPAALVAGSAARLVLAPPAWGREFLGVGGAQRALVALALAAPGAACALWASRAPRALRLAPDAQFLAHAAALLLCGMLQAAAVRPLTQGFLSRGLVAWRAHKHAVAAVGAAAKPSKGAVRADRVGAVAKGLEAAAEEASDVRAALVLIYSQRCQVAALLLAPAALLLALGAALLACAAHGFRVGAAAPNQAAALLREVVAPVLSLLGAAACLCWPLGAAAALWGPAPPA